MAEGVEGIPEAQTAECRANIHDKLTVSSVEFTVAAGVTRPGYTFTGWNTKEDGTGVTYQEGESLLAETDIKLYTRKSECFQFFYKCTYNLHMGYPCMSNPHQSLSLFPRF